MVLLFTILLTILYAMCARMYKHNRSYTESYQMLAQAITWCTAYQLGLMCADMGWPQGATRGATNALLPELRGTLLRDLIVGVRYLGAASGSRHVGFADRVAKMKG